MHGRMGPRVLSRFAIEMILALLSNRKTAYPLCHTYTLKNSYYISTFVQRSSSSNRHRKESEVDV